MVGVYFKLRFGSVNLLYTLLRLEFVWLFERIVNFQMLNNLILYTKYVSDSSYINSDTQERREFVCACRKFKTVTKNRVINVGLKYLS